VMEDIIAKYANQICARNVAWDMNLVLKNGSSSSSLLISSLSRTLPSS